MDIDGSGKFGPTDTVRLNQILNGTLAVNFTTSWHLRIDPADGDNLLKIYRIYHNNDTGADTENIVLSVGFANVKANSLEVSSVTATDTVKGKTGDFTSLKVNGRGVIEGTTIGYVVYAAGSSGAQASCFIPYDSSALQTTGTAHSTLMDTAAAPVPAVQAASRAWCPFTTTTKEARICKSLKV